MKLFYEYMVIFFNLSPTSSHIHPLQIENCDSNSRLVVDEGDNGKFRTERVKHQDWQIFVLKFNKSNFHPLQIVSRGSETQLQVGGDLNSITSIIVSWYIMRGAEQRIDA